MTIVNFSGPNFPEIFFQKIIFKKWLKKTGDFVTPGEILCEIANGQKIAPIKASTSGLLIELLADEGSILMPKQLLARINTEYSASVEEIKDTANSDHPAESQQPAPAPVPEIKIEPERPPVDSQAETPAPVTPLEPITPVELVTNVLTEKDDLKNQASEAAEAATAQSIEQINLLSNKIEALENSINQFHQTRAAERLEILRIIENSAAAKIDEINSSVKQICDRLNFLDDQFTTIASQFSAAIEAIHTAQVKTLEETAKFSLAHSAEETQLSAELGELRNMLAALQKPHTA